MQTQTNNTAQLAQLNVTLHATSYTKRSACSCKHQPPRVYKQAQTAMLWALWLKANQRVQACTKTLHTAQAAVAAAYAPAPTPPAYTQRKAYTCGSACSCASLPNRYLQTRAVCAYSWATTRQTRQANTVAPVAPVATKQPRTALLVSSACSCGYTSAGNVQATTSKPSAFNMALAYVWQPLFNVHLRKRGGIWFCKLGRITITFCVAKRAAAPVLQ